MNLSTKRTLDSRIQHSLIPESRAFRQKKNNHTSNRLQSFRQSALYIFELSEELVVIVIGYWTGVTPERQNSYHVISKNIHISRLFSYTSPSSTEIYKINLYTNTKEHIPCNKQTVLKYSIWWIFEACY